MDGSYEAEWQEIYDLDGIYSYSSWPYMDDGIGLANLSSFSFEGTYYVVLTDIRFGRRDAMDRSILIAKYSNQMNEKFQADGHITSALENICKFQYVQ